MSLPTRIVKEVEIAGHAVRIHACPFNVSRRLFEADGGDRAAQREALATVAESVADVTDGTPLGDFATLAEYDRIAALAIGDEGGKPSF